MAVGIGWNAGALRGRLLGRHRLGSGGCRDLARAGSLDGALSRLREGPYGHDVRLDMPLPSAQWAVAATSLWHLRVLAGWLPPAGAELVRALVGWWEVLNVENHLAGLAGMTTLPPYDLGRLATAWDRLKTAESPRALRSQLAASPWLDPGADDAATIVTWLRLSWAERVTEEADAAARLVAGWAALTAARDLFTGGGVSTGTPPHHLRVLGRSWFEADDLADLRERLPRDGAWVLEEVSDPESLWRAEVQWWRTLDQRAQALLRQPDSGAEAVVGTFGVLLADAHRVQGALEFAARGEADDEAIDEVL